MNQRHEEPQLMSSCPIKDWKPESDLLNPEKAKDECDMPKTLLVQHVRQQRCF